MSVYGTSPIKRTRRTRAEIEALDEALIVIVEQFRPVTVHQVFYQAVNRQQIERWNLPTHPTKTSDTRARRFRQLHGTDSVELDAIPPDELRRLVEDAIDSHMEPWRLEQFRMVEREERQTLKSMFGGAA
jgi:hypothetical protein